LRSLLVILGFALLAACAASQQSTTPVTQGRVITLSEPFDEAEMARCSGSGTGKLVGQAFLKTRSGEVRYGAGQEVVLVPATAYTRESQRYANVDIGSADALVTIQWDPRYATYRRLTIADGEGEFEFSGLPSCSYIVATHIKWEAPTGRGYLDWQGGRIGMEVNVRADETTRVVLTRSPNR
jgi:hypothetical protein